jgi:hypothetical protein
MLKPTSTSWAALGLLVLFVLFGAAPALTPSVSAEEDALLVIVGIAFPSTDISFATLKEVFRGRSASLEGRRLIPVNHPPESAPRIGFDRLVLRLKPAEVGRFWVDARIRDDGRPPTTAGNSELAVRIVASLPNAVSYATRPMLSPKVKVLTVDGKSAGDAGYRLKP